MTESLGQLLVNRGVIGEQQLDEALRERDETGTSLGRVLMNRGHVTEEDLVGALAEHTGMEHVDLGDGSAVDREAAEMVDGDLAAELGAVPVRVEDGALIVAVSNPSNGEVTDKLSAATGMPVRLALAAPSAVRKAVSHLSGNGGTPPASASSGSRHTGARTVQSEDEPRIDLNEMLGRLVEMDGSDLHLTVGTPPTIRVHGELERLDDYGDLDGDDTRQVVYRMLTEAQLEQFENELELDTSYSVPDLARFRVNVFQQRGSVGAVMRVIPFDIFPLEDLGVPEHVAEFAYLPRGLVLITGATGSGKSTTLASLIDLVNRNRAVHIMTVEDPVEFIHPHKQAVVNQREVGNDTHDFTRALKHVLRQDPDVILVGELRDLETIEIALTAAETGHLVFGTLHTQDAPQTVDRLIDVFPPHQQEQIRVMLAGSLQGVVSQQLLKTADGHGRVLACEVMVATSAVRNLLREGKTHQLASSIQAGSQHGMVAMDASLAHLVRAGKITFEQAAARASNLEELKRLAG